MRGHWEYLKKQIPRRQLGHFSCVLRVLSSQTGETQSRRPKGNLEPGIPGAAVSGPGEGDRGDLEGTAQCKGGARLVMSKVW